MSGVFSAPRHLVAYYGGAAILTVSAGLIVLAVLKGANLTIADSGDSTSSNVLAVLICAIAVMVFVDR